MVQRSHGFDYGHGDKRMDVKVHHLMDHVEVDEDIEDSRDTMARIVSTDISKYQ